MGHAARVATDLTFTASSEVPARTSPMADLYAAKVRPTSSSEIFKAALPELEWAMCYSTTRHPESPSGHMVYVYIK
ncbi:hypothetical protein E4U32_002695 [Claviceps aff. humidiphila group G2b]|nr:hypothetical protein E4U32_002695 [Claviceps aff. humidiphila group G2b]